MMIAYTVLTKFKTSSKFTPHTLLGLNTLFTLEIFSGSLKFYVTNRIPHSNSADRKIFENRNPNSKL